MTKVRAYSETSLPSAVGLHLSIPIEVTESVPGTMITSAGTGWSLVPAGGGQASAGWQDQPWPSDLRLSDPSRGECSPFGQPPSSWENDCTWVSSSTIRLRNTLTGGSPVGLLPNDELTMTLQASVDGDDGGTVDDLTVIDCLSPRLQVVHADPATSTRGPSPDPDKCDGTRLTWDLGTVENGTARAITIAVRVDPASFRANSEILDYYNLAAVSATDASGDAMDTEPVAVFLSTSGEFKELQVGESSLTPQIDLNGSASYKVTLANTGTAELDGVDVIDVLPHNHDGRRPASKFSGTIALTSWESDEGALVAQFTNADASSIDPDPDSPSNQPGGSTVWCTEPEMGSPACPASSSEATAVRWTRAGALAPGARIDITVGIQTNGKAIADGYTSRATARTASIRLPITSNDARISVAGADLDLHQMVDRCRVGEASRYSLVLTNRGYSDATNIVVADDLPEAARVGATSPGASITGRRMTFVVPTLASGGTTNLSLSVQQGSKPTATNRAAVVAVDGPLRDETRATSELTCEVLTEVITRRTPSPAGSERRSGQDRASRGRSMRHAVSRGDTSGQQRGRLAFTGGYQLWFAASGVALLAAGVGLAAMERRRVRGAVIIGSRRDAT